MLSAVFLKLRKFSSHNILAFHPVLFTVYKYMYDIEKSICCNIKFKKHFIDLKLFHVHRSVQLIQFVKGCWFK